MIAGFVCGFVLGFVVAVALAKMMYGWLAHSLQ